MPNVIKKGSTNVSVTIRIIDSTTGLPETAVEHNTAGMDMFYRRELAARVAITEVALAALTTAHTDGGIEHISDGYYRVDIPDLAFATGVDSVLIAGTVTGMIVIGTEVLLVDYDPEDGVRLGLTALPNAAAEAAGGLYTRGTGAGQINQAANGQIDVNIVRLANVAQSLTDLVDFADAGYDPATNKVTGVVLVDTVTTNTDMRGTDSAALASVLGALADAAVGGDPTATDTLMAYVKQLINILVGTAGIVTFPAEQAPANAVSLAEVIRAIHADVTGLAGSTMRGTDSAALASVVGALTDAAAAGDPTTADTVMQYIKQLINILIGTTGVVTFPAEAAPANNVSLAEILRAVHADVTGLAGATMRGTDSAALASVATEGRLAELDAGNLPADVDSILVDTSTTLDGKLPAALVSGRMDSDIGAKTGNVALSAQEKLDVNTEADTALTDYDAPTKAEMDTAHALLATPAQVEAALEDMGLVLQKTTIATLASQVSFTLTAGSADNNAYVGKLAVIEDATTAIQKAVGVISAYVGSTKTVTLREDPAIFTMAATDKITILAISPDILDILADVTGIAGATMRGTDSAALASVVTEARLAELDAGNLPADVDAILVDTSTTLQAELDGIQSDTEDIQSRLPAALVGGRMDASVGAMAAAVLTAAAIANDAITAAKIATDAIGSAELATTAVNEIRDAIFQGTLTEGYAADGASVTLEQGIYEIMQGILEFAISGTTITVKKRDGTTTAMTFTIDNATTPTSRTRTT